MARPRRSITYEEKVKSEKKRRVVGGEEGAVQAPPPEEKAEPGAAPRQEPAEGGPMGGYAAQLRVCVCSRSRG